MARYLKQSTAFTFRIGPFVDSTDGVTAETGLSIAQADIQISKNGGAFAQTSASPTTTHDTDGWYQCPLTTTDTNTLGPLTVQINMSGALPVWEHFMVMPANAYDSLVGGSDTLEVDVTDIAGASVSTTTAQIGVNVVQVSGDATAADNLELDYDGTGYAKANSTIGTCTTNTDMIDSIIHFEPMLPDIDPSGGLYRVGVKINDMLGDLPTTAEITPGTVSIARKVPGTSTYIGIATDSAMSEAAGQVYLQRAYDPAVDGFASGDTIRFHFKSISVTIGSTTYEFADSTGTYYYKSIPEAGAMLLLNAEIDTVTSQTELVLSSGPDEDDVINGHAIILTDNVDGARKSIRTVSDWTGSTNTVTLDSAFDFTAAVGDRIQVIANPEVTVATNNDKTGYSVSGTITTLDGLNNLSAADVNAEVDTALADYDAPTKTEMDTAFTEIKGSTWSSGTDTLEAIRDRGDAAWTTGAGGTPPDLLQNTTIATLASQTSFTLTAGSADDDAYNDHLIIVTDSATSTQKAVGTISDYTGSTRTVTLSADPGIFTMAVGDTVDIIAVGSSGGGGASASAIADAVWDEARADHTTAGSFGEGVLTESLNTQAKADVNAEADTALSDYGANTTTPPTAAAIADQVWDEARSGHTTAGSFGESNQNTPLTAAETNAEVDTALTDYGANTTTPPTAAAIRSEIDTNSTQLAAIVADTNEIQTDLADGGRLDLLIDAIKAVTDVIPDSGALTSLIADITAILADTADMQPKLGTPAGADMSADIATIDTVVDAINTAVGALNDISTADVNAQVLDVLNTDTFAELGSVPAATSTLADKITFLFMLARNKMTQTATTATLRNDADSSDVGTATVSDDGTTATRGEFS